MNVWGETLEHGWPDGEIGHEVTIHDVHVDQLDAGVHDAVHLDAELAEIGREYRRQ